MSNKTRLDLLLVERGLEQTRQRAQAMIMSGLVFVDGQRVDKAGTAVPNDAQIEVRGNTLRYVSRGGLKLEKAMTTFGLKLDGCICADIGASTGGFTDCMLQNGATKVYAVDVGYGQLDWKLRSRRKGQERGKEREQAPERRGQARTHARRERKGAPRRGKAARGKALCPFPPREEGQGQH